MELLCTAKKNGILGGDFSTKKMKYSRKRSPSSIRKKRITFTRVRARLSLRVKWFWIFHNTFSAMKTPITPCRQDVSSTVQSETAFLIWQIKERARYWNLPRSWKEKKINKKKEQYVSRVFSKYKIHVRNREESISIRLLGRKKGRNFILSNSTWEHPEFVVIGEET